MFSANENSCYKDKGKAYFQYWKKFKFISALFLSGFNRRKMMENERNDQPEWLNSDESDFSGYSEDDIDSDKAYSSENDDSDQSGSENEQENEPAERWVENDRTARPKAQFYGPVPGANAILGADENELGLLSPVFPSLSI